jgi:DNA polymerase alpha subunit B
MGRICPDNDQVFGDKSVVLEADEERTKARVFLEFKYMAEKGFSVFPGQIVIVEGVNSNGKSINVTDFYEVKEREKGRGERREGAGEGRGKFI